MQETTAKTPRRSRTWITLLITAGIIGVLVIALFANAPRGIDMDLSKIGNGQSALVFVYDSNLTVSAQQTAEMNKIRDDFDGKMTFLIADTGHPDAQALMNQHQVGPVTLLIFSADGSVLNTHHGLLEADELADLVNASLHLQYPH